MLNTLNLIRKIEEMITEDDTRVQFYADPQGLVLRIDAMIDGELHSLNRIYSGSQMRSMAAVHYHLLERFCGEFNMHCENIRSCKCECNCHNCRKGKS